MTETNPTDVIILNRMYVGDYLEDNLGHEVINLIKSDKNDKNPGRFYIYINAHGTIDKDFYSKNESTVILLTQYVSISGIQDTVEVLAKAEGCRLCAKKEMYELFNDKDKKYNTLNKIQKAKERHRVNCNYIEANKIEYGKVQVDKIFDNNDYEGIKNDTSMFVTYEVDNIYKPKYPLYISKDELDENIKKYLEWDEDVEEVIGKVFCLNELIENEQNKKTEYQPYGTELKTYFKDSEKHVAFTNLNNIITKDYWEETPIKDDANTILTKYTGHEKYNIIDIIHKTKDELTHSNLLLYMLTREPMKEEICKFFAKYGVNLSKNYTVKREEGNIDILIKDENNIIVIENKIESNINGWKSIEQNNKRITNQLHKYIHYVYGEKWNSNKYCYEKVNEKDKKFLNIQEYQDLDSNKPKDRHFFILKPDYNNMSISNINKELKIFEDYNIKNGGEPRNKEYIKISYKDLHEHFKNLSINVDYYNEFLHMIERHSHRINDIKKRQMFERFADRIRELTPDKQ